MWPHRTMSQSQKRCGQMGIQVSLSKDVLFIIESLDSQREVATACASTQWDSIEIQKDCVERYLPSEKLHLAPCWIESAHSVVRSLLLFLQHWTEACCLFVAPTSQHPHSLVVAACSQRYKPGRVTWCAALVFVLPLCRSNTTIPAMHQSRAALVPFLGHHACSFAGFAGIKLNGISRFVSQF